MYMLGIFLDIETNGLNATKHKVLEIAYKIVDMSSGQLHKTFQAFIYQPLNVWKQSDPASLEVNGLSWDTIKKGRPVKEVAKEIISCFKQLDIQRNRAVFICQNPSFDRTFFNQLIDPDLQEQCNWPYHWLDLASMYWSLCIHNQSILPWERGISKNQIAQAYHLPTEQYPHKAMNGVEHLLLCYQAIVGFPKSSKKF